MQWLDCYQVELIEDGNTPEPETAAFRWGQDELVNIARVSDFDVRG